MPAVSTKMYLPCAFSTGVSTASRVVPGMSDTMTRSCPVMRLISELLPAFGLPMTATRTTPSSGGVSSGSGNSSSTASSTSPQPVP